MYIQMLNSTTTPRSKVILKDVSLTTLKAFWNNEEGLLYSHHNLVQTFQILKSVGSFVTQNAMSTDLH